MKKTVVIVLAWILMMTFASASVMAIPTNGQKVEATEQSTSITYAGLTALLAPNTNPYPAPPVRERYFNPGHILVLGSNPVPTEYETMQIHSASAYYIITDLNIGGTQYTGVSCNVYDGEYNAHTKKMNIQYDAVWYIGALGDVSSGFAGNIEAKIFNFVFTSYDRLTVNLVMHGFGDFEGQTLMMTFDSEVNTDGLWRGYCLKG